MGKCLEQSITDYICIQKKVFTNEGELTRLRIHFMTYYKMQKENYYSSW